MKTWKRFSLLCVIVLAGFFSCTTPTDTNKPNQITISGNVVRKSYSPLDSVTTVLDNPFRRDTIKSKDGSFSISFTSTDKNPVTTKLRFSRPRFLDTAFTITYGPNALETKLNAVVMVSLDSAENIAVSGKPSSRARSIVYVGSSASALSIKGAGGVDAALLTFEARDSVDNAVDQNNQTTVYFRFISRPDNGVVLSKDTARTSTNGRVTVQLSSGTKAGLVQFQAFILDSIKNGTVLVKIDTLKSPVTTLPIRGGFPDSTHFSLGAEKYNIPGGALFNLRTKITALVGDKFGNPAQPNSVVYFTTTGGYIQGYATTPEDGVVSVDLISGNPIPSNGIVTVTASVSTGGFSPTSVVHLDVAESVDDEAVPVLKNKKGNPYTTPITSKPRTLLDDYTPLTTFSRSVDVLFTGKTKITSADSNFILLPRATKQINFIVSDNNGNPLSEGTTVTVSGAGLDTTGVVMTGDLNKNIPDTQDKSYTRFSVLLSDKRTKNFTLSSQINLTIEVNSRNGNVKKTLSGTLASSLSDSGKVGSIVLVGNKTDYITVTGGGDSNTAPIRFKVLDAKGNPSQNVTVEFAFNKSVNGGEYLSKTIALTDVNGIAQTNIVAGIRAGTVEVVGVIRNDTLSLRSEAKLITIQTGIVASLNLVSVSSNKLSVRGGGGIENATLVFEARDSLGNPIDVTRQIDVNFVISGDTSGAKISPAKVKTDPGNGRVTASFSSGTKSGIVSVTASAFSGGLKSAPVQLTVTGGVPTQSQFSFISPKKNFSTISGGNVVLNVVAGDKYGNPAKEGTPVSFTTNGGIIEASNTLNTSGQTSATLQFANPLPPNGIATVEARTVGEGGITVRDTIALVFSREAIISELNSSLTNFEIDDGGSKTFQYSVTDINGNPLALGTTISVTATGSGAGTLQLFGDLKINVPDTKLKGSGTTQFSFTALDTTKNDGKGPQSTKFTITVDGPNTNGSKLQSYDGVLKSTSSGGNGGKVASVTLVQVSSDSIVVNSGGAPTTDTLVYVVKDVVGAVLKGVTVQPVIVEGLNSGEYLSPSTAISNDSGKVSVILFSGVKSGEIKVAVKVIAGSVTSVTSDIKTVYVKPGPLASIEFISLDNKDLSVKGVGGTENASLIFEAHDGLGNALIGNLSTKLYFQILGGPGFGEQIKPDSVTADPVNGRVKAVLTSGTKSTVLQVIARNASGSVKSTPVTININGGFPVDSLLNMIFGKRNFSIVQNAANEVTVQSGDRYGNPVRIGTALNFATNGGIIEGSKFTDAQGNTVVKFQTINDTRLLGPRSITANTIGEGGVPVSKIYPITISGEPILALQSVPTDTVTVFDGSSSTVNYTISDFKGNPVSSGHIINVKLDAGTVSSELDPTGDLAFITVDTQDGVNGIKYQFVVRDKFPGSGTSGVVKVTISAIGVGAGAPVTSKRFYIKLLGPNNIVVPPSARKPAQIGFLGTTATDIYVSGVGATENSFLTYEVRDSLGVPIDASQRVLATFSSKFFPNTFAPGGTAPTLLPTSDSTDASGKVRVSILSGTQAGVVQVIVQIAGTTIKSQPVPITVHAGFADKRHFTLAINQFNFPGLEKSNVRNTVTVQVVDKYSNPVKSGTAVYFNTAHGGIQTGGLTNNDGFVTNELISGNPLPIVSLVSDSLPGLAQGYSRVYARTIGQNMEEISDSIKILWTGKPIITKTSGASTFAVLNAGSAAGFTFTVKDYLGHPMSPGTTITVSGNGLSVDGDSNILMPDTFSTGAGLTDFTINSISDSNPLTTAAPVLQTSVKVTVTHSVYGTYTLTLASGTVQ